MRTRSIRFRLTVWYAVALTLGLGLFSGLVWLSLRQRLVSELDRDLEGRAGRFEQYFRGESLEVQDDQLRDELNEFCQALPPGSTVNLRGSGGFEFHFASQIVREGPLRLRKDHFSAGGQTFELEAGEAMGDIGHTLDLLRLLLLSLLPVVIVLACAGGGWLSGRALKPIQDLTAAASAIGIENLSERLPVPATGDELARLTDVLNSMLARLEAALKRLSQFAADASHELRTPLAVLRTTAELALRRSRTPESYRESLGEIAAETERMTQLIEDLLTLARSGTEAVQMPRTSLDLRALVREVCTELVGLAQSRQIRIEAASIEAGSAAIVSGNRPALRRLFVILLDNAIKFSPAGAEVQLRLSQDEGRVSVSIEDAGAGISAADLPHIFERFYRAGEALNQESGGHGIGLALADHIARAHGATIEVRSTEGTSSVFRVSFAAAASSNLQIAAIS